MTPVRCCKWHGFRKRLIPGDGDLYSANPAIERKNTLIRLIPYCLWNNRGKGEMQVYLYEEECRG